MRLGLLFERFLSPERDGPPDIDLDIESGRREEVIQYVYERYGRHYAAQVANVITYRARSAVRDMAKALGADPGPAGRLVQAARPVEGGDARPAPAVTLPATTRSRSEVLELAAEVEHFPRHLGIHSGGMVLCDRPVIEVCPVEWGRMADRSVLQWDKDDCAAVGLVKFDLLGLGMLTALHHMVDLIARAHRRPRSTWPPSRRTTRSTTCCARPTPSACSRWSPGPRWPRCPGCGPAPSTTSWWRWRSSGPGPSRAGRCTPTSAAATARSPSPTCTRCWSRR